MELCPWRGAVAGRLRMQLRETPWMAPRLARSPSGSPRLAPRHPGTGLRGQRTEFVEKDPWEARNHYVQVVVDRSDESLEGFLDQHAVRALSHREKTEVLRLLELQRHAMLMYTSCGWFFDELSGIETVQVIRYAARALQLGQEVFDNAMEPRFVELLERARSNIPAHRDGRLVYEQFVRPAMVDLENVGAHYAMTSLFEEYAERTSIYCYTVDRNDYQISEAGKVRLVVGRAEVTSETTRKSAELCFCVLHLGDHNLNCGVREYEGEEAYQMLVNEISEAFSGADFAENPSNARQALWRLDLFPEVSFSR